MARPLKAGPLYAGASDRKWSALMGRLCSQQVAPRGRHDLLIYKSRSQPRNLPMHSVHRCPHKAFPLRESKVKVPIALVEKLSETNVHFAPLPDKALSVRQTPPPAAPTQTVHLLLLHTGSMASAVTRPEVVYAAPLKVNIAGKFAVLGPASVQAPRGPVLVPL